MISFHEDSYTPENKQTTAKEERKKKVTRKELKVRFPSSTPSQTSKLFWRVPSGRSFFQAVKVWLKAA